MLDIAAHQAREIAAGIDRLCAERAELIDAIKALIDFCIVVHPGAVLNPCAPHFKPVADARNLIARLDAGEGDVSREEVQKLKHGLYRVWWTEGDGQSLAAVGSLYDGSRWLAPTNWTSKTSAGIVWATADVWDHVERVERLFPLPEVAVATGA